MGRLSRSRFALLFRCLIFSFVAGWADADRLPPQGASPPAAAFRRYFPKLVNDGKQYTGLAVLNLSAAAANLTFKAYSDGGVLLATAQRRLESLKQMAQLVQEVFPALSQNEGWLLMESDQPNVEGFFLIFDGDPTVMDGTSLGGAALGEFVLPGADDAEISLINPSDSTAAGTLEYTNESGGIVASQAVSVPPRARSTVRTRLLRPPDVKGGCVFYRGDALAGMMLLGNESWLGVLGVLDTSPAPSAPTSGQAQSAITTLYAPQFAFGGGYVSVLDVVNLESKEIRLTLKLIGDNGVQVGSTGELTLGPRGAARIDSPSLFGLAASDQLLQGYVVLKSSAGRFAGWIRFTDPAQGSFGSSLALVKTGPATTYFSQVAQNDLYFTGLAVLNLGEREGSVRVTVCDTAGTPLASGIQTLPAGGRFSRLLTQLVGPLPDITKGYFSVTATQPMAGFALFGTYRNGQVNVLSAIPPQTPSTPEAALFQPADLEYQGAFRLPGGDIRPQTFDYGGNAMTFNPRGDQAGPQDDFPGSLFITGHDRLPYGELPNGSQVAEVSIPVPVKSRDRSSLKTAGFLQEFHDVAAGQFAAFDELPRIGMEYLYTAATGPKIHIAWGQHFQEDPQTLLGSHAWISLNLAAPDFRGVWKIGNQSPYSVNGYLFVIPADWADLHAKGRYLGTGRFRDGGWSGMGPALFAYRPWVNDTGTPAPSGAHLEETTLLLYEKSTNTDEIRDALKGYQHGDEWEGGAWLSGGSGKSSVLFAGTKSSGAKYWYGWVHPAGPEFPCVETDFIGQFTVCRLADGSPCPSTDLTGCTGHSDYRGWWSSRFDAQLIFYDPVDLARVAKGQIPSWIPQPYAALDIDDKLFMNPQRVDEDMLGRGDQRRYRIGSAAFDRGSGLLYVLELFADDAKPIVHVWKLR